MAQINVRCMTNASTRASTRASAADCLPAFGKDWKAHARVNSPAHHRQAMRYHVKSISSLVKHSNTSGEDHSQAIKIHAQWLHAHANAARYNQIKGLADFHLRNAHQTYAKTFDELSETAKRKLTAKLLKKLSAYHIKQYR